MEIKPLKSYKAPAYPEKIIVIENPGLLKMLPQRWKGNVKAGIALSSVVMLLLAGCGQKTGGGGTTAVKSGSGDAGIRQTSKAVLVAPIFEHGAGRGAFGCVSVAPPAFLSEAEAYEVIAEEMKREGISLEKGGLTLEEVGMPLTSLIYEPEGEKASELKSRKGSLELDGYDSVRKIAYEFVSKDDIVEWVDKDQGAMSTVESYDAVGTAKRLEQGLQGKSGDSTVAVFYDPMGYEKEVSDKYQEEFRKISENKKLSEDERNHQWTEVNQSYEAELMEVRADLLREQVKGFLDWLKAQGII